MSKDFEKFLSDANNKSLLKQAGSSWSVEIVDELLTPMVHVKVGEVSHSFTLEKLGFYYADLNDKFYRLEDDEEASARDITDTAIEAHLQQDINGRMGGK